MRYIKSCGFIAYKEISGEIQYLIIKAHNGDVGFPKGHMEAGESEIQTAIRELREETGVTVEIVSGFRRQIEYPLPRVADAIKQTVYFLGRCTSDKLIPQETEVVEAVFLPYEEALAVLTFDETRKMLREAEDFRKKA